MQLVLVLVLVLGMDVLFHIVLLTSRKGRGMHLIDLSGYCIHNHQLQAHEH